MGCWAPSRVRIPSFPPEHQKVEISLTGQQLTEIRYITFTTCFHHMSGAKNRTFKYDAVFSLSTHYFSHYLDWTFAWLLLQDSYLPPIKLLGGKDMKRVAIYLRTSSQNQTCENQLIPLKEYAQRCGYEIVGVYEDWGVSGSKNSRPSLDSMLLDARRRKFSIILAWIICRIGRNTAHLC